MPGLHLDNWVTPVRAFYKIGPQLSLALPESLIVSACEHVAADNSHKPGRQGTTHYLKLGVLRLVKGRLRECSTL